MSVLAIIIGVVAIGMGQRAIATRRIQYRRHVMRDAEGNPLESDSIEGPTAVRLGAVCIVLGIVCIGVGMLLVLHIIG